MTMTAIAHPENPPTRADATGRPRTDRHL